MNKLTPEQIILVNQIKEGTPLHNDIDNVELLRKVLKEIVPDDEVNGNSVFYHIKDGLILSYGVNIFSKTAILLSSFLPKMIEVDDRRINKAIAYINGGLDSIELNEIDEIYGKSQVLDMLNDIKNILQPKL